jgi:hypothetical protein
MERYRLPIPWDAVPVEHRPPYKRFDPSVPQGYPLIIHCEDGEREPDPRKYQKQFAWSEEKALSVYWELRKEFY